jgi:hypothetical protein
VLGRQMELEISDSWRSSAAMRARRVGDSDLVVSTISARERPDRISQMCMHDMSPGDHPCAPSLSLLVSLRAPLRLFLTFFGALVSSFWRLCFRGSRGERLHSKVQASFEKGGQGEGRGRNGRKEDEVKTLPSDTIPPHSRARLLAHVSFIDLAGRWCESTRLKNQDQVSKAAGREARSRPPAR